MSLNSCTGSTTLTGPRGSSTLRENSKEEKLCIQVAELHGEVDESKDEANQELLEQKTVEDEALKAINEVLLKLLNFILTVSSYHNSNYCNMCYRRLFMASVIVLMFFCDHIRVLIPEHLSLIS